MYNDIINKHGKNPLNFKKLEDYTYKAESESSCFEELSIFLKMENDIIIDASFYGEASLLPKGLSSLITEYVKGKNIHDIYNIEEEPFLKEISGLEEIPERRLKAASLPLSLIKEIYQNNFQK